MYNIKYKRNQSEFIMLVCCAFLLTLIGVFRWSAITITASICVMIFAIFVAGRYRIFYIGMMAAWFILDQVYFDVLGGTFRIYFACSLLIIFILIKWLSNVLCVNNLLILVIFLAYILFTAIFSDYMLGAVKSSLFLILNSLTAFATFTMIYSGVLTELKFAEVLRKLLVISIVFGLFQFVLYRFTGNGIGFSPTTATQQLSVGQIPGFRTEANTHGKLVAWSIIFSLPPIINGVNRSKYRNLLFLAVITLVISMTRSALYAMLITMLIMTLWYLWHKGVYSFFKIAPLVLALVLVVWIFSSSGLFGDLNYSLHKLNNLFLLTADSLKSDGSASYRLSSLKTGIEIWGQSFSTKLFGVGYGQTWATLSGMIGETRTGATDIISILAGAGIIGLGLFVLLNLQTWKLVIKTIQICSDNRRVFAEQILFCSIYGFCIGFFSGSIQNPEFWIAIGCSAAMTLNNLEVAIKR